MPHMTRAKQRTMLIVAVLAQSAPAEECGNAVRAAAFASASDERRDQERDAGGAPK
jgi:hypothetical protein